LAATLDKDCAKKLVTSEGVATPKSVVVHPAEALSTRYSVLSTLTFPVILKPAWEGSSKGIRSKSVVDNPELLLDIVAVMRREYRQPILIEEYIEGDELTVGVVGNDPPEIIGIMRIEPREPNDRFVYGLDIKRDYKRLVKYECPAPLSAADEQAVRDATMKVWLALGCRDVARIDFRLRDGVPYFLEVNPLPGLNPADSDLVIMAKLAGWTYERLIGRILQAAIARTPV